MGKGGFLFYGAVSIRAQRTSSSVSFGSGRALRIAFRGFIGLNLLKQSRLGLCKSR